MAVESGTRKAPVSWAGLVLAGIVLTACGGEGETESEEPETLETGSGSTEAQGADWDDWDEETAIRFIMSSSPPGYGQAHYTSCPESLGFWEDEGIDITIDFSLGAAAVQSIAAGQGDIAPIASGPIVQAVSTGVDVNAIAFYNYNTTSIHRPAVLADAPYETMADLEGVRIGVQSLEAGAIPILRAMLDYEGVDPDSVEFLPVGLGPEAAAALEGDRVDVLGLWDDRHAEVANLGLDVRLLESELADELGFQGPMIVRTDLLEESPEVVARLGRAVAMCTVFAMENPEAAIRMHWEVFPESRPSGVSEEDALAAGVRTLTARLENSEPVDDLWGYATPEQIEQFIGILDEAGALQGPPPTVEDIWTDELIEWINDFDSDAVRETARSHGS